MLLAASCGDSAGGTTEGQALDSTACWACISSKCPGLAACEGDAPCKVWLGCFEKCPVGSNCSDLCPEPPGSNSQHLQQAVVSCMSQLGGDRTGLCHATCVGEGTVDCQSSDCASGQVCRRESSTSKISVCTSPGQMGDSCGDKSDCQAPLFCSGGHCDSVECRVDSDCDFCSGDVCLGSSGRTCVQNSCHGGDCSVDSDCGTGEICGATGTCHPANVECTVDGDCQVLTDRCDAGHCVGNAQLDDPCTATRDCAAGLTCDPNGFCTNGGPVPPAGSCIDDTDCPNPGDVCRNGQCGVRGTGQAGDPCMIDGDCAAPLICDIDTCA